MQRVTRSRSRSSTTAAPIINGAAVTPRAAKRAAPTATLPSPASASSSATTNVTKLNRTPSTPKRRKVDTSITTPTPSAASRPNSDVIECVLLHPALTFSFADAREHLHSVDQRWGPVIDSMRCKPFQPSDEEEAFDPFRSLVSSIIGQQVSWLAARSILHKFQRVFYPELPEKLERPQAGTETDEEAARARASPFPTPQQVLELPNRTERLRGAGLSGRKLEYIVELAERFDDGRLSAKSLWGMGDDEVTETLVACRGIGLWTAQMFQMFSMKRPNVIPCGDLGIQKALCKWYSSDPFVPPLLHPKKLSNATVTTPSTPSGSQDPSSQMPAIPAAALGVDPATSLIPITPKKEVKTDIDAYPSPEPTPIHSSLISSMTVTQAFEFPETSSGLTPAVLKSRLAGKKIKGAYLTPDEVKELCRPWEPFASVAMWYLWSILSDV